MSYPFEVHPDPMMRESNRLLDAVEQSRSEQSGHHSELESAVSQMWGQSKGALAAAHEALVDRARVQHNHLTAHGAEMQQFTGQVIEMDDQNGNRFGHGS